MISSQCTVKEMCGYFPTHHPHRILTPQCLCSVPRQEYERLAAQLDGAKTDLTKRVNEISQAVAKEALVKRAEEHAQLLSDLAKQMEK